MNQFADKIKKYFIKKWKTLFFLVIFGFVFCIYNLDNQNINFILRRGVVLEYSLQNNQKVDQNKLKDKLVSLGIKYSYIDEIDESKYETVDNDNQPIANVLRVALPKKALEKSTDTFNSVSNYIFDNYKGSKLINLRSLNDRYSKGWSGFLKGLLVLSISFVIWVILLQIILRKQENFILTLKNNVAAFFKEQFSSKKDKAKADETLYTPTENNIETLETKNQKVINILKEIVETVAFVIVFVIIVRYFIGELRWIPSGSMRPTIVEKDRVFVEKLNFPTKKEIQRGDILVFYPPETILEHDPISVFQRLTGIFCKDVAFIKRVVGLPNDKFEIKKDSFTNEYRVFINDKPLNEPYISSKRNWTECSDNMYCGPFIIPEKNYFMMGDNRNNSQDSRFWGFLDEDRVIGRANFMFYPFSRINILKDKYLYLDKEKTFNSITKDRYILNRYEFLYKI